MERISLGWRLSTAHGAAMDRYLTRPDREAFSVVDVWTGEAAVIAMTPQTGLSQEDAAHAAELLNRRARQGERTLYQ